MEETVTGSVKDEDPFADWRTEQRAGTGYMKPVLEALHYMCLWLGAPNKTTGSHAKALSVALRRQLLEFACEDLAAVPNELLRESDLQAMSVAVRQLAAAGFKALSIKGLSQSNSILTSIDSVNRMVALRSTSLDSCYPVSADHMASPPPTALISGSTTGVSSWLPPRLRLISLLAQWQPLPFFDHLKNAGSTDSFLGVPINTSDSNGAVSFAAFESVVARSKTDAAAANGWVPPNGLLSNRGAESANFNTPKLFVEATSSIVSILRLLLPNDDASVTDLYQLMAFVQSCATRYLPLPQPMVDMPGNNACLYRQAWPTALVTAATTNMFVICSYYMSAARAISPFGTPTPDAASCISSRMITYISLVAMFDALMRIKPSVGRIVCARRLQCIPYASHILMTDCCFCVFIGW